jgi:hypothetical protein
MTTEEIEAACDRSRAPDCVRHALEAPELTMTAMFYPLGFPTELRTNSVEVLSIAGELWALFDKRFDTEPIRVDVHVVEGSTDACPQAPEFRMMLPLLISCADVDNYMVADLARRMTQMTVSRAAVNHRGYLGYFFLTSGAMSHIATHFTTPVHGGCVSLDGRGVLLCGDSGAGKSSLSYAFAKAGWTYVTDDGAFLLNHAHQEGGGRLVLGNCHQVRFRPSAAQLFPEIEGFAVTPRAAGKPSIEMPTAAIKGMICAPTAEVDHLVFLNRHGTRESELKTYHKDVARRFLQQTLYGLKDTRAAQHEAIERLLTAEIYELCYRDLTWAVDRLETLVRRGC